MFDMLHSYMLVVYTYYYRGVFKNMFGTAIVLGGSL